MKINKSHLNNLIFLGFIFLLVIPQTRTPIQVLLHKGLALFGPSVIEIEDRVVIDDYDWQLRDINGKPFNFQQNKNKVVLINFWATWCPPCIAEMPSIQKLYDDYQDKIEFVLVSNEDIQIVNQFLENKTYTFNSFLPVSKAPQAFDVTSIPRTFLLDRQGHIVIDKTGASNWNSESVKEVINELLN